MSSKANRWIGLLALAALSGLPGASRAETPPLVPRHETDFEKGRLDDLDLGSNPTTSGILVSGKPSESKPQLGKFESLVIVSRDGQLLPEQQVDLGLARSQYDNF